MRSTEHALTVDFVERSLRADLRLERIAAHVGYSPYHLHRSFRRVFGLTLHTYVHRRRLTEAARALINTSEPIIDVALRHGFRGRQSFTNAFSASYGVPPAAWRHAQRFFPLLLPYRFHETGWDLGRTADGLEITDRVDTDTLLPLSLAAVDMLPMLDVEEHTAALRRIDAHQVLLAHRDGQGAAAMIIEPRTGHIEYLAVHPLVRRSSVLHTLLHAARERHPQLSVTTFREGDRADLGHRRALLDLGFRPAPLCVEFGYPTQLLDLDPSGAPQ
ncbi:MULTISPECIES: helix-turn-helix transcriptional regulator [unclassified Streptomyces]|uniref:helix-turn-helix transcriptional regulator n=1 Tax=unclassified Streptomyces TaxID=2593676 RepID=UPI002442BC73|nr:helix-turn-helix transcriptional regulator [Streptomyces sp. DH41]MDG9724960.1 helix-turn-helix transcriptional regulator [Streptomyces sp. DH41]